LGWLRRDRLFMLVPRKSWVAGTRPAMTRGAKPAITRGGEARP
jgi:hypothetical protein